MIRQNPSAVEIPYKNDYLYLSSDDEAEEEDKKSILSSPHALLNHPESQRQPMEEKEPEPTTNDKSIITKRK